MTFFIINLILNMVLAFILGYFHAKREMIKHVQKKILPKTHEMVNNLEDFPDTMKVVQGRLEVTEELFPLFQLPFARFFKKYEKQAPQEKVSEENVD